MNKTIHAFSISIMVVSILTFFSFNSALAQFEIEMNSEQFGEVGIGDFIEMQMYVFYDEDDMETTMSGYARMEFTGEETITIDGNEYICMVALMTGTGDIDTNVGMMGTWSVNGNMYIERSTEETIKETNTLKMTLEYQGEKMNNEQRTITIPISKKNSWTSNNDPGIGDKWTITTVDNVEQEEYLNGRLMDSFDDTDTTVTHYEYLEDKTITIGLGTFDCRKIMNYDEDEYYYDYYLDEWVGEYSIEYQDKSTGMQLKYETFEDDDENMEMEIIAYKLGEISAGESVIGPIGDSEKNSEAKGLFGLGKVGDIDIFILAMLGVSTIVLVIVIIGMVTFKKRKRARSFKTTQYPHQPRRQTHQTPPPRRDDYYDHGQPPPPPNDSNYYQRPTHGYYEPEPRYSPEPYPGYGPAQPLAPERQYSSLRDDYYTQAERGDYYDNQEYNTRKRDEYY